MKYWVNFSCGHTEEVALFGKHEDRYRRIEYLERCGVCSKCYQEQKDMENSVGCHEVRMHYKEYKNDYSNCKTKSGSYDGETKTIIVYVPEGYVREPSDEEKLQQMFASMRNEKGEKK